MGRGSIDLSRTKATAIAEGVTRRTIQRRLRAVKRADDLAQPNLPNLEIAPAPVATYLPMVVAPLKKPAQPARIDWEEASARGGATEKMISARLREALVSGDIATARVMSSAYRDMVGALRILEEQSEQMASARRWRERVSPDELIKAIR